MLASLRYTGKTICGLVTNLSLWYRKFCARFIILPMQYGENRRGVLTHEHGETRSDFSHKRKSSTWSFSDKEGDYAEHQDVRKLLEIQADQAHQGQQEASPMLPWTRISYENSFPRFEQSSDPWGVPMSWQHQASLVCEGSGRKFWYLWSDAALVGGAEHPCRYPIRWRHLLHVVERSGGVQHGWFPREQVARPALRACLVQQPVGRGRWRDRGQPRVHVSVRVWPGRTSDPSLWQARARNLAQHVDLWDHTVCFVRGSVVKPCKWQDAQHEGLLVDWVHDKRVRCSYSRSARPCTVSCPSTPPFLNTTSRLAGCRSRSADRRSVFARLVPVCFFDALLKRSGLHDSFPFASSWCLRGHCALRNQFRGNWGRSCRLNSCFNPECFPR